MYVAFLPACLEVLANPSKHLTSLLSLVLKKVFSWWKKAKLLDLAWVWFGSGALDVLRPCWPFHRPLLRSCVLLISILVQSLQPKKLSIIAAPRFSLVASLRSLHVRSGLSKALLSGPSGSAVLFSVLELDALVSLVCVRSDTAVTSPRAPYN